MSKIDDLLSDLATKAMALGQGRGARHGQYVNEFRTVLSDFLRENGGIHRDTRKPRANALPVAISKTLRISGEVKGLLDTQPDKRSQFMRDAVDTFIANPNFVGDYIEQNYAMLIVTPLSVPITYYGPAGGVVEMETLAYNMKTSLSRVFDTALLLHIRRTRK